MFCFVVLKNELRPNNIFILISHFCFILFVSSMAVRWSERAGLLLVEAAGSKRTPVWPLHFNPPPVQSQNLHCCLQRDHQSWRFPSPKHHAGMQGSWAERALLCMRVDVQEQSNARLWRLPPNNGCHAGVTCRLCHHHQEKPKSGQEKGHCQDEQEEEKGKSACMLMSTS